MERPVPQVDPFDLEDRWIADGTDSTFIEFVAWFQQGCPSTGPGVRWVEDWARPMPPQVTRSRWAGMFTVIGQTLKVIGSLAPGVGPVIAMMVAMDLRHRRT